MLVANKALLGLGPVARISWLGHEEEEDMNTRSMMMTRRREDDDDEGRH